MTLSSGTPISTLAEDLSCSVLRGESTSWPQSADAEFQTQFLRSTDYHGIQPLLYVTLKASSAWHAWPPHVREILTQQTVSQAAQEMVRRREITSVLDTLARRSVIPLLMRGVPLAYAHYGSPELRPVGDLDIIIQRADLERTQQALADLGFERTNTTRGELVSYEVTYGRRDRLDVVHLVDVHWKVNNFQAFAVAFSFEQLAEHAISLSVLGAHARALGSVHALTVACMHRVTHATVPSYFDGAPCYGDRLIWLYDIHLLAKRLSHGELAFFTRLATDTRLRAICLDGLRHAQRCFGTQLPDEALAALAVTGPPERSARYLDSGRLRCMVEDIRALPNWRDRVRLAAEHLFPPTDYVLRKYGVSSRMWLPALYLYRGVSGMWHLLHERSRRFSG